MSYDVWFVGNPGYHLKFFLHRCGFVVNTSVSKTDRLNDFVHEEILVNHSVTCPSCSDMISIYWAEHYVDKVTCLFTAPDKETLKIFEPSQTYAFHQIEKNQGRLFSASPSEKMILTRPYEAESVSVTGTLALFATTTPSTAFAQRDPKPMYMQYFGL